VESLRSGHHPTPGSSSASSSLSSGPSAEQQNQTTAAVNQHVDDGDDNDTDDDDDDDDTSSPKRYLRIRNFNSFVFKDADLLKGGDSARPSNKDEDGSSDQESGVAVGKDVPPKPGWNKPRLITEPSTTPVKGVFTQDIVSCLPYTEVMSEEMYEVTDVMMDDSRLLLLKVSLDCLSLK
jgi:hypothetical protein